MNENLVPTIDRVINNNIILTHDQNGKEIILMGRGLGFKKTPNATYDPNCVDKMFVLNDFQQSEQLIHFFNEIPDYEIDAAIEILDMANKKLNKSLNDSLIISLSDHIHTSIIRNKKGIFVKNLLLWDIQKFYPDEYKIGLDAVQIIKDKTDIELDNHEAGFIALHIVNAQMEDTAGDMYGITKIMQEIMNIIKYTSKITINEDSIYYYRFITHLKFFAQRLLSDNIYEENEDETLLTVVKQQYKDAYRCVLKVVEFVSKTYHHTLSNEEQLYLTIHIERIISKSR